MGKRTKNLFINPRRIGKFYKDKMAKINMNLGKRGQVTIFIILAILIVGIILAFVFVVMPSIQGPTGDQLRIESCVGDVTEEKIETLALTGGIISPEFTYSYDGEEIPYFCYTDEYFATCTIQNPFPEKTFEHSLQELTKAEIEDCYAASVGELERKGYEISSTIPDYILELQPGKVNYKFGDGVTIQRVDSVQQTADIEVNHVSRIYEQLLIATTILQQESTFGDSDVSHLMRLYPEFIIEKLKMSDGTTIYIITDKDYGTEYKFASRSLAWPPGYGLT